MDNENKYNNALKKLQEALAPKDGCKISGLTRGCIENIFPELVESEDERIRKELTEFLKQASGGFLNTTIKCKTFGKWLSWLEKQDKQ